MPLKVLRSFLWSPVQCQQWGKWDVTTLLMHRVSCPKCHQLPVSPMPRPCSIRQRRALLQPGNASDCSVFLQHLGKDHKSQLQAPGGGLWQADLARGSEHSTDITRLPQALQYLQCSASALSLQPPSKVKPMLAAVPVLAACPHPGAASDWTSRQRGQHPYCSAGARLVPGL